MATPSLYIGDGLHFCTSEIQASPKFTFGGRSVVLIDTPGFNDAVMVDGDEGHFSIPHNCVRHFIFTLHPADPFLRYESEVKLAGVIYFCGIS